MDLRVSQAELVGLHIELRGLQESVMGSDIMGINSELTVQVDPATGLGTAMNGQGLSVTGEAGEVLVTGQLGMLCWFSRYTQYSIMEL